MTTLPPPPLFISGLILFARLQSGKSTGDIAGSLDTTYQYFWDIENGYRTVSLAYLEQLIPHLSYTYTTFWALLPAYLEALKDDESKCARMILSRMNSEKQFNNN